LVFRACGLFPYDANAVDYTKLISFKINLESRRSTNIASEASVAALQTMENYLPAGVLALMTSTRATGESWQGDKGYEHLYGLWLKMQEPVSPSLKFQGMYVHNDVCFNFNSCRTQLNFYNKSNLTFLAMRVSRHFYLTDH
jgi:hypothetical protein